MAKDKNDNIITIHSTDENTVRAGLPLDIKDKRTDNDGNGGGNNMNHNDKYVTHQELSLATEKILHHMDNKFAETNLKINDVKHEAHSASWKANWILGILGTIFASIIAAAIITLLHL